MKNVQIPVEVFDRLCDFLLDGEELPADVVSFFCEKRESRLRREVFSKYKTSPPMSDEREHWRQVYLDMAGVLPDWQSEVEVSHIGEPLVGGSAEGEPPYAPITFDKKR
jgi:hypothetical protein